MSFVSNVLKNTQEIKFHGEKRRKLKENNKIMIKIAQLNF